MINETISPSGYKIIPIWIAMSHACLCTGFISANFSVSPAPDRYSDFLAHHKRLVRTLLDMGFRYGLHCRKIKQFYRSHHSLVQRYSHSATRHLREDVDSQVRWWRIGVLLVGAAVTGTDRLSIYPFTGVLLAFSSFLFLNINFLKFFVLYFILFFHFFVNFNLFIDFFLLSIFNFSLFFTPIFLIFFFS